MDETLVFDSTKHNLGLIEEDTSFDLDVLTAIRTAYGVLNQAGVGSADLLIDKQTPWVALLGEGVNLGLVQSYIWLRVRLQFDPPQTSFAISAIEKQLEELIWRIEIGVNPAPPVDGQTAVVIPVVNM